MAKAYTFMQRKTEDAIEALVTRFRSSYLTGITIYKGASMTDLTTPRLQILCLESTPEVIAGYVTGNWSVTATIAVISHHGDASRTDHQNRCGELDDILMIDDAVEQLRNVDVVDWYIKDSGWRPQGCRTYTGEGEIITEYTVQVHCCAIIPEN